MDEILKRLDATNELLARLVELTEMQIFGPPACEHQNAVDHSTMGMAPGEKRFCPDCGNWLIKGEVQHG